MTMDKSAPNYKFDKVVKSLYADMSEYFANERVNHVFRPFGCDMAFVDAQMNYVIMDELIK
jgi:hypothetical protein